MLDLIVVKLIANNIVVLNNNWYYNNNNIIKTIDNFTSFAVKPRTSGRGCKAMITHKNLINHMSSYRKNVKIPP